MSLLGSRRGGGWNWVGVVAGSISSISALARFLPARTQFRARSAPIARSRAAFGLTNPKAYPVALAMFSAIVAPYIGALRAVDAPQMFASAALGFLLADAILIFAAGLPAVRRFFLTHGVPLTRLVGVIFILFGARSIAEAASGAMRRTA